MPGVVNPHRKLTYDDYCRMPDDGRRRTPVDPGGLQADQRPAGLVRIGCAFQHPRQPRKAARFPLRR